MVLRYGSYFLAIYVYYLFECYPTWTDLKICRRLAEHLQVVNTGCFCLCKWPGKEATIDKLCAQFEEKPAVHLPR